MRDGERRVVVTGMGALTPVGNDVPSFWDSLVNGRSGITRITSFDPVKTASKVAGEIKGWDAETVMPRKEIRRNDRYVHYAWGATVEAMADAGLAEPDRGRGARVAHRRDHRLGHRGHQHDDPRHHRGQRARHRAHRPVPRDRADPGHGRGLRRDLRQRAGSELRHGQRVLEREPRDRRLGELHPSRRRRRHDRRRRRGGHRRDPVRRVQRDAGPLDEVQRRPGEGVAPVRRRARRVRDGGRRRHPRARGARARPGAGRDDPRRAGRLRRDRRRLAHHPAGAGRTRGRRVDARRDRRRRPPARRHRLHQRPRHLDAAERPIRDGRDQDALRRGRLPRSDQQHEVDDRPPHGRRRRGRGDRHDPDDQDRHHPAHDQPRAPRPRVRPRLRPERGPRGRGGGRHEQQLRLRRATTPRSCFRRYDGA